MVAQVVATDTAHRHVEALLRQAAQTWKQGAVVVTDYTGALAQLNVQVRAQKGRGRGAAGTWHGASLQPLGAQPLGAPSKLPPPPHRPPTLSAPVVSTHCLRFVFMRRMADPLVPLCVGRLGLRQGPRSRELLQRCTSVDLSNAAYPFRTAREIDIGFARVLCTRITYVGELGYELFIPAEQAVHVYETLMAAMGSEISNVGLKALGSLRMEKGYRDYGHDLDNTDSAWSGVGWGWVLGAGGCGWGQVGT
jgi:hypothetical protein